MNGRRQILAALLALVALFAVTAGAPKPASAQERRIEGSAKEAIKRARADYSASDFDGGLARLLRATRACGTIRCTAATRAALLRDTGVMQLRRGSTVKADEAFAEAIRIDKRIELVAPYDVPDVRAEWNAVIAAGDVGSQPQPTGDFSITPPPEQTAGAPLPIYAEYGGSDSVSNVVVKYKSSGGAQWKRTNLTRTGKGWGGLVPCGDVKLGYLLYYVQGFDSGGTPNALSGDPKHPFHTAIRRALVGPAPHLPGQAAPSTCREGEVAATPVETPQESPGMQCIDDSQCNGGLCQGGHCVEPAVPEDTRTNYARFWFGLSLSLDLVMLPGASDACKLTPYGTATGSYFCTNADGSDYPSRQNNADNNALVSGKSGQVNGGPAVGNVRLLVSFDYAFSPNVLVGARIGAVMHDDPAPAAGLAGKGFRESLHFEARGTYVFGVNALAHSGFAPLVFLDGGLARFDASQVVTVTQSNVPGQLPKTAWHTGGPGFAGVGGGVRYAFSQRIAMNAALKLAVAFGGNGVFPTLGPEIALQYGF